CDVELRFKGNKDFEEDELASTVSEFYSKFSNRPDRDAFIPTSRVKGHAKGNFLEMELHVFMKRYILRTGEDLVNAAPQKPKHRRSAMESDDDEILAAKRSTSGSGPLVSTFVRNSGIATSSRTANKLDTRSLSFKRVTVQIEDEAATPKFSGAGDTETGVISVSPILLSRSNKGRSKDVYEFTISGDSTPYVAKKVVREGPGMPVSDVAKQCLLLLSDLARLARGSWFANRFESRAEEFGVEPSSFRFTDAFIIDVPVAIKPQKKCAQTRSSARSGGPLVVHGSSEDEGSDLEVSQEELSEVFLVEPRHSTTQVEKYRGTMDNQNWSDHLGATMNAFAHFVVMDSACEYMSADLQDLTGLQDIWAGTILIDPMSHTPLGKSGLGDFGLKGIQCFINTHHCSPICKSLRLASMNDLQRTFDELNGDQDLDEPDED
ncbi:hypothetical protein FS837_004744, partial [Tulasnella sp. UAMH 9824]